MSDFSAIPSLQLMPPARFQERMDLVYRTLRLSTRLLGLEADELGEVLVAGNPDNPTAFACELAETADWLRGLSDVLGCTRARSILALAHIEDSPATEPV